MEEADRLPRLRNKQFASAFASVDRAARDVSRDTAEEWEAVSEMYDEVRAAIFFADGRPRPKGLDDDYLLARFETLSAERSELSRARLGSLARSGATYSLLWNVEEHLETLALEWSRSVRPGRFGKEKLNGFASVWSEFLEECYWPSLETISSEDESLVREVAVAVLQEFNEMVLEAVRSEADRRAADAHFTEALSPTDYERLVEGICKRHGWSAQTTKASGDQGVDVIAISGTMKVVLQCKLYSSPVGNKAVQEVFAAAHYERANASAVVSNAAFTRSAQELAHTNKVGLLHHDQLGSWLAAILHRAPDA